MDEEPPWYTRDPKAFDAWVTVVGALIFLAALVAFVEPALR